MKRYFTLLFLLILLLTILTSCNKKENEQPIVTEEYSYSYDYSVSEKNINIDESWKNAYVLKYSFYDNEQGSSSISECCNGKEYVSVDNETGIVTYITSADGFLIQYFLDPSSKEGTMSIITGNSISDLQSGFYLMSVVDKKLPLYTNTVKSADVTVASRSATQYIQTGTSDNTQGNLTAIIDIDNQYGFASKCELYDEARTLMMKWELEYFSADINDVNSAMPEINLDDYNITSSAS